MHHSCANRHGNENKLELGSADDVHSRDAVCHRVSASVAEVARGKLCWRLAENRCGCAQCLLLPDSNKAVLQGCFVHCDVVGLALENRRRLGSDALGIVPLANRWKR